MSQVQGGAILFLCRHCSLNLKQWSGVTGTHTSDSDVSVCFLLVSELFTVNMR